ncbi:MAG: hypothetical protein CSA76_02305 [Spirochaetales bacterium]|nr:MAG: hypothetical protein CSA76_02305 [Spirochaetales bacterium]
MAKTMINIRFFTVADYREETDWLRRQHQSGWKLKKFFPPCFFAFEACQPEDVIYQLDYKNKRVTADYLQLFDDYGWKYCGSCLGWNYFRKPLSKIENDEEREIFSDTESKLTMVEHIFKTRILPLLIIFCTLIIPQLFMFISGTRAFDKAIFGMFALLAIVYLYIFIRVGFKLRQIRASLKN